MNFEGNVHGLGGCVFRRVQETCGTGDRSTERLVPERNPVNRFIAYYHQRDFEAFYQKVGVASVAPNKITSIDSPDRRVVGASAGGLDAFEGFTWAGLRIDGRVWRSFLLKHLDPSQQRYSLLARICRPRGPSMESGSIDRGSSKAEKPTRSNVCSATNPARFKNGKRPPSTNPIRGQAAHVIDHFLHSMPKTRATEGSAHHLHRKRRAHGATRTNGQRKPSTTSPIRQFAPYGFDF